MFLEILENVTLELVMKPQENQHIRFIFPSRRQQKTLQTRK